jgi:hypothetical protein
MLIIIALYKPETYFYLFPENFALLFGMFIDREVCIKGWRGN